MSVRLSRKHAGALLEALDGADLSPTAALAVDALRQGLKPKPVKPAVKARRARKKTKRATKADETQAIRAAVVERSGALCEVCFQGGEFYPVELDHFFGRVRVPQSVRSCWMLCTWCHRLKTNNSPSPQTWLSLFAAHARKHGFINEERMAQNRLKVLELKSELVGAR